MLNILVILEILIKAILKVIIAINRSITNKFSLDSNHAVIYE